MHWTISRKLFAALLIFSMLILLMSYGFGQLSFRRGFNAYLAAQEAPIVAQLAKRLVEVHQSVGDWSSLRGNADAWRQQLRGESVPGPGRYEPHRRPLGADRPGAGGPRGRLPPRHGRAPSLNGGPLGPPHPLARRAGLYDATGAWLAGAEVEPTGAQRIDLIDAQVRLGELRIAPLTAPSTETEVAFANQQSRSLALIALLLLGLSVLAAWIVARQFTQPIRRLAEGTQAIMKGRYDQPIAVAGQDELGALAVDVNALAQVLDDNREARRRWIADVNHEMRTPLAVLRAEMQALEDGFRTFDARALLSLQAEVDRLEHLTEDLYTLSSSDEGGLDFRFAPLDGAELLTELLDASRARIEALGLTLETQLPDPSVTLIADANRITQLISNLLENALRYTDAPGVLRVAATLHDDQWQLVFEDSAPGVPAGQHDLIFERLYRVERSRSRAAGGSGLGLAICRAIVEGQGGKIRAMPSDLGGLRVVCDLPLAGPHPLRRSNHG